MSAVTEFQAAQAAHSRGDLAKAERLYRGLTRSMPYHANHNLGVVLMAMGKFKAAEEAAKAALAAQPGDARPLFTLAQLRLAEGDYAEGFKLWESRRGVPGLLRPDPAVPAPEWQGEDLTGKRLLVVGEQGLGDHIMFARFIAPLAARAASVVFLAPPSLGTLFAALPATVVERESDPAAQGADLWVLQSSIPGRLGVTLDTLPPPADFGIPLTQGGGIGVVPKGGTTHQNDAQRSLFGKDEQRLLALGRDLRPEATGVKSFRETAELIAGLDLVISVDTSVAHLAASLGKPTWILIQAAETDWRWGRTRTDTPWYPSARLFRQRLPGDWAPVLRQLQTALGSKWDRHPRPCAGDP